MSATLNVGILAHVDAGKTSLTERLLFDHGSIAELGSVDDGTTRTDSGDVERRRGITIRTAVASFRIGELQVNLIDTPGHPDFIAEVQRCLTVLDAAVLLISAVEGVQAQTRVLMRTLRRAGIPVLIFVNKIDRMGARHGELLAQMRATLSPALVPMQHVTGIGTPAARVAERAFDRAFRGQLAELLAEHDDELLGRILDGELPPAPHLHELLAAQVLAAQVHPVYFGSALTGAGCDELAAGLRDLLPREPPSTDGPPQGEVFAIERPCGSEKLAYLRLFAGTVRARDRVTFLGRGHGGTVERARARIGGLEVVGAEQPDGPLVAGNIGRLHGLAQVRIGDRLGEAGGSGPRFAPPVLEAVVRPRQPERAGHLHAALTRLADEDPLIRTRTTDDGATSVLLYGAVQREVLAERLEREFGLAVEFAEPSPVFFERPHRVGRALSEFRPRGPNEYWQTIGLRVDPAPFGDGNSFRREVALGIVPLAYQRAIEEAALDALRRGQHGREVLDCAIALTHLGFNAPMSSAGDFRALTERVLRQALDDAGTDVYEPGYAVELEVPEDALSGVIGLLAGLDARLGAPSRTGSTWTIPAELAARLLADIAIALPGLTHGEGALWYEPGPARPVRARTSGPLVR